MAFIGGIGALFGGGLFSGLGGQLLLAGLGIGLKLAVAYFFPQKIQGPRAESLKAQTSKFGDPISRIYGTVRTAGAVIWLRDDKIQEHVRRYRQGKAIGPEVTEYSYTATFAVALAWNGPMAAVPRIWADDKLIYDASAESLEDAIAGSGQGIGVAKGASIAIYLGTDDQEPDPDIEADRGTGEVPAWPKICYVVIKNLPLDEFGIRVPNIEAEIVHVGTEITLSLTPTSDDGGPGQNDIYGNYFITAMDGGDTLSIQRLPACTVIATKTLDSNSLCIHITERNQIAVTYGVPGMTIFDAATGALEQQIDGVGPADPVLYSQMDDITVGGVNYLFSVNGPRDHITCLSNSGDGYAALWEHDFSFEGTDHPSTLSASPERLYMCGVLETNILIVCEWDSLGVNSTTEVTLSAIDGFARACFYDEESDSVIIQASTGSIYIYTPDLATLLRSTPHTHSFSFTDPLLSKRMKLGSDLIGHRLVTTASTHERNDIRIYRVSDLAEIQVIVATDTDWDDTLTNTSRYTAFSDKWQAILAMGGFPDGKPRLWFLPRAQRSPEPLADVIEAECTHAGLPCDVSEITTEIYGYAIRDTSPPRGVLEDLSRVNFFDWAQIDGTTTFFPRKTTAARTLTVAETGLALNGQPDPVQVRENYPALLDLPEQVIISYPSYDAEYRTGAQAANTEKDPQFSDEPSEADETGAPVRSRKLRPLEFSTSQVLTDDDAAKVADLMHQDLRDAATNYKTSIGPYHLDLHPGEVINLPLDDDRVAKAVITKMAGETLLEMEFRKRGDSYSSDAVGMPLPFVRDNLLNIAPLVPVLIDGHLLRSVDDDDGFYAGVAVVDTGQFRSGVIYRSADGGTSYDIWAAFANGTIRGIALDALPNRPHPAAFDRTSSFNIAVPNGTAPDSVSEAALLASSTSNAFAVWNASVGDWEYIRAATVVDNADGTWTLSTLLRGQKGTEFAMAGHAIGAKVYHLDENALDRPSDGDRTLSRKYVAVPTSTVFDSTNAVTFTNYGKGLRPWAPVLVSATLEATGDWTFVWNRRDRLGQAWPESGSETPPMSEDDEEYTVKFYDGGGVEVGSYTSATETYVYSVADQTTDFGAPQTTMPTIGIAQVSATYGDGIELREAA